MHAPEDARRARLRTLLAKLRDGVEARLAAVLATNRRTPPPDGLTTTAEAGMELLLRRLREAPADQWAALIAERDGTAPASPDSPDAKAWAMFRAAVLDGYRVPADEPDAREAGGLLRDGVGASSAERFEAGFADYRETWNAALDAVRSEPDRSQRPYLAAEGAARVLTGLMKELAAAVGTVPPPDGLTADPDGPPPAGTTGGPAPASDAAARPSGGEPVAVSLSGRVKLFGPHDAPMIDGGSVETLNAKRYAVVKAVLATGEAGLSKDGLMKNNGVTDARGILDRLRKKLGWMGVISFPGEPGGGYRIR